MLVTSIRNRPSELSTEPFLENIGIVFQHIMIVQFLDGIRGKWIQPLNDLTRFRIIWSLQDGPATGPDRVITRTISRHDMGYQAVSSCEWCQWHVATKLIWLSLCAASRWTYGTHWAKSKWTGSWYEPAHTIAISTSTYRIPAVI